MSDPVDELPTTAAGMSAELRSAVRALNAVVAASFSDDGVRVMAATAKLLEAVADDMHRNAGYPGYDWNEAVQLARAINSIK